MTIPLRPPILSPLSPDGRLRDRYAAARALGAFCILDPMRRETYTLSDGTVAAMRNALGGALTLTGAGGGFVLDEADYPAIVLDKDDGDAALSTTTGGVASGGAHTIHVALSVSAAPPSDFGTLAMLGRQGSAGGGSVLGVRSGVGTKPWNGNFVAGALLETSGIVLTPPFTSIISFTYDGTEGRLYVDGINYRTGTYALSWGTGFGITAGSVAKPPPDARMYRATFAAQAWTKAQLDRVIREEVREMRHLMLTPILRTEGDSITAGTQLASPSTEAWPVVAAGLLGVTAQNAGVSGETANNNTGMTAATALLQPRARKSVCTIAWGRNDIDGGRSAAQVIADLTTCIANARAAGYDGVAIATIIPAVSVGHASNVVAAEVNTWIRESSGCIVLDFAALPHAANPQDATYYQGDNKHPTATLAAEMGEAAADALEALFG